MRKSGISRESENLHLDIGSASSIIISNADLGDAPECPEHSSPLPPDFHGNPKLQTGSVSQQLYEYKPEVLRALSKRDLIAMLHRQPVVFYDTDVSCLFHSLWERLTCFKRECSEGKNVLEALYFVSWVSNSGLLKLFESYEKGYSPITGKVNAASVRGIIAAIREVAAEQLKGGKVKSTYEPSDIAEINRKLDVLAAHVARISSPAPAVETAAAGAPALQVIDGGGR
jgi:hypothetical protein